MVLIVSALGTVYYWETFGREKFLYKEVLTFKEAVARDTVITPEVAKQSLVTIKVEENKLIENAITDKETIIDLATTHYIPKNAQLSPRYFESHELVLEDNQYIFKVPGDWILAMPSSIRRKDTVYFYEVSEEDTLDLNVESEENSIPTFEKLDADTLKDLSNFVVKTTVAYAKDNANREVTTVSNQDRYDGTARISELEIVTDSEQLQKLKDSYKRGNKFIILYQEN